MREREEGRKEYERGGWEVEGEEYERGEVEGEEYEKGEEEWKE